MRWLRVAFMAVALAGGLASAVGTAWAATDEEQSGGCTIKCEGCKVDLSTGRWVCEKCTFPLC